MDPKQLRGYRILGQIGRGGMATVFEAVHEQIGRRVAIKLLREDLARNPEMATRFLNEARATNLIAHPSIVEIYDLGQTSDGSPYIVMEYLQGETLAARMSRLGGSMAGEILPLGRQIASVLAAAHRKHIVHRDIKPDNVMLVPDPEIPGGARIKLLDFGIAKLAGGEVPGGAGVETRTGVLMGTPVYMSPEQCHGAGLVTDKSDVYSFGILLYECLSGQLPFAAANMGEVIAHHVLIAPRPLREAVTGISQEWATLVHRMLAKDPAQRPTMDEVAEAMVRLGAPRATPGPGDPFAPVEDRVLTAVVPPKLSTLEDASGQMAVVRGGGRSRWTRLGTAGLLIGALTGVGAWLTRSEGPVVPRPVVQQATRPQVRWSIETDPPAAQVVRVKDGAVLGLTPFSEVHAAADGAQEIELRRPGFASERITLELGVSRRIARSLVALPARPAPQRQPTPARKTSTTSTKKIHKKVLYDAQIEILK